MVVALFAPPLEAWIRWVAPFYALTITFRKPNCAHLASNSVVNKATSSILQAACCLYNSRLEEAYGHAQTHGSWLMAQHHSSSGKVKNASQV